MSKFYIKYGLGREFNIKGWEEVEEESLIDAEEEARRLAIEEYQDREGMYGLMDEDECEEEGVDYWDEVESEIQYEATDERPEDYE